MKTKYLKIEGKKVEIDSTYYRVSGISPYELHECKASNENNIINSCYFLDEQKAKSYQKMVELLHVLNEQVKTIENEHSQPFTMIFN